MSIGPVSPQSQVDRTSGTGPKIAGDPGSASPGAMAVRPLHYGVAESGASDGGEFRGGERRRPPGEYRGVYDLEGFHAVSGDRSDPSFAMLLRDRQS